MSKHDIHEPTVHDGSSRDHGIVIRRLGAADAQALARLAGLDSAPRPTGEWIGAEVEGRLLAAASLDGQGTVADPFSRTDELRALLELRASQLGRRSPHRRRRRRARASLAASPPGAGGRLLTLPIRPF